MFELSIKSHFAASHSLRGYEGKCRNLHGHTWKTEVIIESNSLNDIGMVIDFKVLKKKLEDFLEELDHVHLNDLTYFHDINPTTENLARYIFEKFSEKCRPFKIVKVIVWESDYASVTYDGK